MTTVKVRKKQILQALDNLNESRWEEVLDFIGYLQTKSPPAEPSASTSDLLQSELIGIWEDRTDIEDSLTFARNLRRQAEQRHHHGNAAA